MARRGRCPIHQFSTYRDTDRIDIPSLYKRMVEELHVADLIICGRRLLVLVALKINLRNCICPFILPLHLFLLVLLLLLLHILAAFML